MATVNYTISKTSNPMVWVVSWVGLAGATNDVGQAFDVATVPGAGGSDRSIQFLGTFGTSTLLVEGSNDGTNYVTLADPQGNALSKTAAGLEAVLEYTRMIRPSVAGGGTGSGINCYLIVKGSR